MHRIISLSSFVLVLAIQLYASPPDSTNRKSGTVNGNGYAYEISAPKGWVLDFTAAASYGLDAVLYPDRSSFSTSPTVMYVDAVSKKTPGSETVSKYANVVAEKAKKSYMNVTISHADSLATKDHKKAYVQTFGSTQFQAEAYVDEDSTIITFVLRAKDKNRFDNARYSLKDLVASYRWGMKKP